MPRPVADISPSMPIDGQPRAEHVTIEAGSTPMTNSVFWSLSCLVDAGARSRSAVTYGCAFPTTGRCGCPTRVSIRLSINRTRGSFGLHDWHRIGVRRCAPVGITAGHISASGTAGRDSSSPCLLSQDRASEPALIRMMSLSAQDLANPSIGFDWLPTWTCCFYLHVGRKSVMRGSSQ